jgi:hypothetical protein
MAIFALGAVLLAVVLVVRSFGLDRRGTHVSHWSG